MLLTSNSRCSLGSTDDSYLILESLKKQFSQKTEESSKGKIPSTLLIKSSIDGLARGAGFARNKAIELRGDMLKEDPDDNTHRFLCLLDSDDTMHHHRVAEQTHYMLFKLDPDLRYRTLLGCNFVRDPPDSQWHYSSWANSLSDERLMLEQFREVTILQPTWFLSRKRLTDLGGYVEAPTNGTAAELVAKENDENKRQRLIHVEYDNLESLKLAEDLRFFHEHLASNGILRLHRTKEPLVMYRHNSGSQSFRTSRKLLLQLRVLAFERSILGGGSDPSCWQQDGGNFIVWGAGRDGKDFVKALSPNTRKRVYCFVDVDCKKLESGNYVNRQLDMNIPIIHFSYLARDPDICKKIQREWEENSSKDEVLGCINKAKSDVYNGQSLESLPQAKRRRVVKIPKLEVSGLSQSKLQKLPVVVCVAMYRTNGVLEKNVQTIGRIEGKDLWHFS